MTNLRGVDGCRAGWISVAQEVESGQISAGVFADSVSLLTGSPAELTAIDIPIGLPTDRPRRCDVEARRLLGHRGSSVFPTPVRAALSAETYEQACRSSAEACGKRLSKQAFGILPRIRSVDSVLRENPGLRDKVVEVHPELCFYYWNGQCPMLHPKR